MQTLALSVLLLFFLPFFAQSCMRTAELEKEKLAVENTCPFHPSALDLSEDLVKYFRSLQVLAIWFFNFYGFYDFYG